MTRVLIVDDQPAFRRQLRRLLSRAGMTVVGEAGDLAAAVGLVAKLLPDLAVVDVMLPDVNGIEGISRLRAMAPDLRVVLVSAYRDHAELFRQSARQAGADAFVSKDELDLETVRSWGTGF